MPYVMRERSGKIDVVNPLTGDVKGTFKSKRQALAQMRALYANVPDAAMKKRGNNEPVDVALWERAKTEAKKRFEVYPSAYANAWAAQWYKERGGDWRKKADASSQTMQKDLRDWFKEDWVDISKPIRDNGKIVGYEACGRSGADASAGGYPKCLPKAKAMKLSEAERMQLINRKRQSGMPVDGKPQMASNQLKKTSMVPANAQLWMQAKNEAKINCLGQPLDAVNAWATAWYRDHGGTWKDVESIPTEIALPPTKKVSTVTADLQKLERAYMKEEWVDISKPIKDNQGLIVGFQPCYHSSEEHQAGVVTCMPKRRALKLTADDRAEILHIKEMNPVKKSTDMKKYGRYRRK